ncbi:DUF3800 domain-containing protein [Streptomyces erythrochromogenes]|uniref:DUF3800 domain-containing protein n=1 Tax=Streptomyces erythrochromogenes TaxID=285574 RepID=UPI0038238AFB
MNVPRASLPAVYADESSNSGQNLLDPDQPVFTVAGVHLADELAAAIVDEVRSQLPPTQGEPKYGSLARSSRGRKALTRAFEQLPPGSTRSFVVNKSFMVMTKLVDTLVETRAHADGYNLYENGEALALANLLHMAGPVMGDAEAYRRLQQAFVDWVRQRSSTDEFFEALAAYKKSIPASHSDFAEYVEVLEYCRGVAEETAADLAAGGLRDLLDPAVTSLYAVCTSFADTLGQFRLVHDSSKVIDRHAMELRMAHLLPDPAKPGYFLQGLGATQIDFTDSKAHPQLQLADWAAGAVRQWATHMAMGGGDQFARDLESVVQPWIVGTIWPAGPES